MSTPRRWDRCVNHRGSEAEKFINDYFNDAERSVLMVGAAGFDVRSTILAQQFSGLACKKRAVMIREERQDANPGLRATADGHARQLEELIPGAVISPVSIFGPDRAVVGGRNMVSLMAAQDLSDITDVVIDFSAISIGVSFPAVRYFTEKCRQLAPRKNLHVCVAFDPTVDELIKPLAGDSVDIVHGFRGGWGLHDKAKAAKLWLPQLSKGRLGVLQKIWTTVEPHDTCPILPFPSRNPRFGDELADHYIGEFQNGWPVDPRNIVYAAEDDPLDLYRTILQMDDRRGPVFEEFGGSLVVISPVGSRVLALGALMSAIERDFPIVYVESIGYLLSSEAPPAVKCSTLIHLWLEGDVYPTN